MRRSPGHSSRYAVNHSTASREPDGRVWTASARDREDAARRAQTIHAVIDLAPSQAGDSHRAIISRRSLGVMPSLLPIATASSKYRAASANVPSYRQSRPRLWQSSPRRAICSIGASGPPWT